MHRTYSNANNKKGNMERVVIIESDSFSPEQMAKQGDSMQTLDNVLGKMGISLPEVRSS
jgi:hypothetical protein